ncbi:hypothetical protein FHG87_009085 [Trinorchestia longiramus]|nr:hypothetical protein FHG87_009085 [Trinorchestia longiramus]
MGSVGLHSRSGHVTPTSGGRRVEYNEFGEVVSSRPHTPGLTQTTHTQTPMLNQMPEDHYMHHMQQQEDRLLHLLHHDMGHDLQEEDLMHHHHMQPRDMDADGADQMQQDDYNEEDIQEEQLGFTSSASKDPLMW